MKVRRTLFRRLGFGRHAEAVYDALRTGGGLTVSEIARLTGIHRPPVYESLRQLIERDLASRMKRGKRNVYAAKSPQALRAILRELERELTGEMPRIEKARPAPGSAHPEISVFDGRAGITAIFSDVVTRLPRGATFYRYTSERDLDRVNRYLPRDYRSKRDAKHLERLVISNPESGKAKRPRLERFIKFIPPEASLFDQDVIQLIYGDRVAFIDLNAERGFVVHNKQLADFQKVIFKQLYKKL
ncbi:hypothetical protein A2765_01345 [Candidatus Kaiserbacteria bacterium RIFCSPHIGHO2_01_FULL_56_24]|uniref:Transcription regulator TrmB N-terminal domain-containing protein n=1 Tax=Candidatus Kaiserbacteria bacterium RIFCSPHIGHO2_01_FULL_56_24 TaxID=1798487 RepID=A0A1F6DIA7_9BACT|nr:MAG: hypothetical protein A2765_01345 [Candidatus Kaiserbacteria bacterium RIFCSPHIGHO2_01_FULL_56_24]